jgi:hypothetical protein
LEHGVAALYVAMSIGRSVGRSVCLSVGPSVLNEFQVPANKLLFACKVQANKLLFPKEFQQITIKKQCFYFAKDKKMEYPINQQPNKFALENLMYEIP